MVSCPSTWELTRVFPNIFCDCSHICLMPSLKYQATDKSQRIHGHLNPAVSGVDMGEESGQMAIDGPSTERWHGPWCVPGLPCSQLAVGSSLGLEWSWELSVWPSLSLRHDLHQSSQHPHSALGQAWAKHSESCFRRLQSSFLRSPGSWGSGEG